MSDEIGIRVDGKDARGERWYRCSIMGEHTPESETVIETNPASRFLGMRVCLQHLDEASYDDNIILNPPRGGRDET